MKVLNLCCAAQHRFEGWFASEDDFTSQIERRLLVCPMCGDAQIQRLPSAPHVVTSTHHPRPQQTEPASSGEACSTQAQPLDPQALQAAWLKAVAHVIENTVDVGPQFAEEARRMHYGETAERPIRGQATPDEARLLRDEGIEVAALPLPAALKGPIQ